MVKFNTVAPKHQEQNGMVERHWGTIMKLANKRFIHARSNQKFIYNAVKYVQYIHDVMSVKALNDKYGFPTYFYWNN